MTKPSNTIARPFPARLQALRAALEITDLTSAREAAAALHQQGVVHLPGINRANAAQAWDQFQEWGEWKDWREAPPGHHPEPMPEPA